MPRFPTISSNTSPPSSNHARAVALFTVLVVVALVYFVLYPSMERIRAVSAAITETKTDLYEKQNNSYSLQNLLTTYRRYEPRVTDMERSVRARSRELELITALEALAEADNLQQRIQVGDYTPTEGFPYYRMPLKIVLEGDFADITQYLRDMERLASYVIVTNLTITNPSDTRNRRAQSVEVPPAALAPLEASITADTFWQ